MTMALGKIEVDIVANTAKFNAEVKKAQNQAKTFGQEIRASIGANLNATTRMLKTTAGAFVNLKSVVAGAALALGAAKIVSSLDDAADSIDKLGKVALRLNIPVEQLSALKFAAGESGLEFEKLAGLASKAGKEVAKLVNEGATSAKVGKFNVRLTDSNGEVKNLVDLLPALAQGIESAGSAAEQLRLSQKFFGRGGGDEFVTFLKESGGYIKGMADGMDRAGKTGAIFTQDQVNKLTAYRDSVGRVQAAWFGLKVKLATEIAPPITDFLNNLSLRLAQIPDGIKSIGRAMTDIVGSNSENRLYATGLVTDLGSNFLDVLKSTAVEAGRVIATVFTESLRLALHVVGPELGDVFRDAIGPALSDIPGVDIGMSSRGKLAKLKRDLAAASAPDKAARAAALQAQLDRLNDPGSGLGYGAALSGMGMGGGADPRARLRQEIDQLLGDADRLKNAVAVQESIVNEELIGRTREVALAMQAYVQNVGAAADGLINTVGPKATALRDSYDALLGAYPGEMGPPAPAAGKNPIATLRESLAALANDAESYGTAIWDRAAKGVKKGLPKLKQALKDAGDVTEDLVRQAREIRFSLYPDEKLAYDLANVRELREALVARGKGGEFTEEDVAREMARIVKAGRVQIESLATLADEVRDTVKSFAGDASAAFTDFAFEGKASLADLGKAWAKTLFDMAAQALLFKPIFDAIGGGLGSVFGGTTASGTTGTVKAEANGDAFLRGSVIPFARGGVVSRPTLFPMANGGIGKMGEAGPEAIMPLQRIGGKLGVRSAGGGVSVQIIDQRGSGSRPQVTQTTGPDGRRMIQILIRDEMKSMIGDGTFDRTLGNSFGLVRKGASR
jgi:hypothetical protein